MDRRTGRRKSVLFVCIENSSRSVMAEAFARRLGLDATSAGTVPAAQVNPIVTEVMKEVGADVSQAKPKKLTEEMIEAADVVVLTDATLKSAIPSGLRKRMKKKVVEWYIPDPQGRIIEEIRFLRDEIEGMVKKLAEGPVQ